jgi:hypothetical protein
MFNNVMIILNKQMRQQQDIEFQQPLKRARDGGIIQADVDRLNTRVISRLESQLSLFTTYLRVSASCAHKAP